MIKVHVAGPYTKGDPVINTRNAIAAGEELSDLGFAPFIPHLTLFWHLVFPHEPDFWYEYDYHWLDCCDCLLRLPGDSVGADKEMQRMISLNRPVFLDIESLVEWRRSATAPADGSNKKES